MRGRSFVLCYHAISRDWPSPLAVSAEALAEQVGHFLGRGYEPQTFERVAAGDVRGRSFAVTFDDAYLSVYERAFPKLEALGVPATIFVPTGQIGANRELSWAGIDQWHGTKWAAELRGASWNQIRELASAGWEIGSHTEMHPRLPDVDGRRLAEELGRSRERCTQEIGRTCATIAYPYGAFDQRVAEAASSAGYSAAAALDAPMPSSRAAYARFQIPRVAVYRGDSLSRIRLKVQLLSRQPRLWNALLAVRDARR